MTMTGLHIRPVAAMLHKVLLQFWMRLKGAFVDVYDVVVVVSLLLALSLLHLLLLDPHYIGRNCALFASDINDDICRNCAKGMNDKV